MNRIEPYDFSEMDEPVLAKPFFGPLYRHAMQVRRIRVGFEEGRSSLDGGRFDTTACAEEEDSPDGDGDPRIAIYCAKWGEVDDIDGTCTLAHELGHQESWLRCEYPSSVVEAIDLDHPEKHDRELREEYLREERRAWRYGREILLAVAPGFPLEAVDRAESDALNGYIDGLALRGDQ